MVDPPIYGTPRIEKKFVFERQKKKRCWRSTLVTPRSISPARVEFSIKEPGRNWTDIIHSSELVVER